MFVHWNAALPTAWWLSNRLHTRRSLKTGLNQKSQGAISGLYGGCGKVLIPCGSKYSFTKADFWVGALSCNKWYPGYQCADGHCCNVSGRLLYTLTYSYKLTRASTLRQKRWFQFPHCEHSICSYIPAASAYEVYISQLIRYSRTCGSSNEFIYREVLLTRKLVPRGS